jgi:hypothetical protein
MDPNDPGAGPGDQTTPSSPETPPSQPYGEPVASPWAPPSQPYGAPQYGAPQYGAPPAQPYDAPPAQPYGAPPAPPYGGVPYGAPPPAWGVPVAATRRSPLPRIIALIVVIVAVVVAAGFIVNGLGGLQKGKVLFSTDVPQTGTHSGCSVDHQVTSVTATTPVYANYIWTSQPGTATVTLTITKDGQAFSIGGQASIDFPSDVQGTDCFSDTSDLSQLPGWGPGTFHFSATSGSDVLAAGDLTVK